MQFPSCFNHESAIWKPFWQFEAMPKVKLFWWKILRGAVPTNDALAKRRIVSSGLCVVCNQEDEDVVHMLFACPYSNSTWFASEFSYIPNPVDMAIVDWWVRVVNLLKSRDRKLIVKLII